MSDSTPEPAGSRSALSIGANLDIVVMAVALVIFAAAGLPIIGWALPSAAWIVQKAASLYLTRAAAATGQRQQVMKAVTGTMMLRLFLVSGAALGAGLIDADAGIPAALLAVGLVTANFVTMLVVNPLEAAKRL